MATVLSPTAARWVRWLEGLIFFFLILFAILLPHSIKGARHAWMAAGLLWLAKLAIERKRPFPQPLSAPLLAYVVLSGISTALSPDPYLSWPRMKIVCLVLAGIVVAQNLQRLSQVRILVWLLLLSGLAAAAFTAWQYTLRRGRAGEVLSRRRDLHRARHPRRRHHYPCQRPRRAYSRATGQGWWSRAHREACSASTICTESRSTSEKRSYPRTICAERIGHAIPAISSRQAGPCARHFGTLHRLCRDAHATRLPGVGHVR